MGLRPANWETSTEFNQRWESSSKFLRWRWNMFENTNYQTTHWCETYHSPIVDNHKGGIFVFCWVWLPRGGKNLKHWIFYIPSLCKKKNRANTLKFYMGSFHPNFTMNSQSILRFFQSQKAPQISPPEKLLMKPRAPAPAPIGMRKQPPISLGGPWVFEVDKEDRRNVTNVAVKR